MKERILTGWNFRRVIYGLMGIVLIVQSINLHEWFGIFVGLYFAAMGIFALGCASGNCSGEACYTGSNNSSTTNEDTEYEEIK